MASALSRNAHDAALLYQWLDFTAGTPYLAPERRRAIRLLVDLATKSGKVPDGHYLHDVEYASSISDWFGGCSDVHQATWFKSGIPVCVVAKRLRVNEGHEKMLIHKVCSRSS
jgi:hypothetical protein